MRVPSISELYSRISYPEFLLMVGILFLSASVYGQYLPLHHDQGKHFLTDRKENPYFLTAEMGIDFQNLTDEQISFYLDNRKINRVNTICIPFLPPNQLKTAGQNKPADHSISQDHKIYSKHVRWIHRLAYEAVQRNMLIMISLSKENITELVHGEQVTGNDSSFLYKLLARMQHCKNVIWLLEGFDNSSDLSNIATKLKQLNTRQLIGYREPALSPEEVIDIPLDIDLLLSPEDKEVPGINDKKLVHLLYIDKSEANDSLLFRRKTFGSILSARGGIVYANTLSSGSRVDWKSLLSAFRPGCINRFKSVFDTVNWSGLIPCANLVVTNTGISTGEMLYKAECLPDSSLACIYFYAPGLVSLNTGRLKKGWQLYWINPATGEQYKSSIFEDLQVQEFLPPQAKVKNSENDWLLIIKTSQK